MPPEPRTSTTATAWCLHEPWAARICFFASFGYMRQCHCSKNGRSHTWRTPSVDKSAFVIRRESIYSHTTRNKTLHLGLPFSANDNPRTVFNRRSQFVPRSAPDRMTQESLCFFCRSTLIALLTTHSSVGHSRLVFALVCMAFYPQTSFFLPLPTFSWSYVPRIAMKALLGSY